LLEKDIVCQGFALVKQSNIVKNGFLKVEKMGW